MKLWSSKKFKYKMQPQSFQLEIIYISTLRLLSNKMQIFLTANQLYSTFNSLTRDRSSVLLHEFFNFLATDTKVVNVPLIYLLLYHSCTYYGPLASKGEKQEHN